MSDQGSSNCVKGMVQGVQGRVQCRPLETLKPHQAWSGVIHRNVQGVQGCQGRFLSGWWSGFFRELNLNLYVRGKGFTLHTLLSLHFCLPRIDALWRSPTIHYTTLHPTLHIYPARHPDRARRCVHEQRSRTGIAMTSSARAAQTPIKYGSNSDTRLILPVVYQLTGEKHA